MNSTAARLMYRLTLLLLAALVAATVLTVTTPAAPADAADSRPCATKGELRKVKAGWSRVRVQRVIDSRGRRYAWGRKWQNREWRRCNSWNRVGMLFVKRHGAWRLKCEGRCWWRQ